MPEDEASPPPLFARIWKFYKIPLILGSVSLSLIVFSVFLLVKSVQTTTPITFTEGSATPSGSAGGNLIIVDVEGAVVSPGTYRLPQGARVEEAISAAGDLSHEADSEVIAKTLNRAVKLTDGAKVFIPKLGDSSGSSDNIVRHGSDTLGGNIVNVNIATAAELDSLPGVGPVTAQKIISGRPYQTLDELVAKKVMSQSLFDKLQNQLSL